VPEKVLVIDDDPALIRMIRLTLLSEGLEVETASDGVLGLEATERTTYAVILLDLQMPNLDGRGFFREFRARGGTTPILLLSAYGAQDARHELGAEAAVTKPFDPAVLLRVVRSLLPEDALCEPRDT
jgi:two-component system KDP operon response regulator KdpE